MAGTLLGVNTTIKISGAISGTGAITGVGTLTSYTVPANSYAILQVWLNASAGTNGEIRVDGQCIYSFTGPDIMPDKASGISIPNVFMGPAQVLTVVTTAYSAPAGALDYSGVLFANSP
jgi:hypothetical protein